MKSSAARLIASLGMLLLASCNVGGPPSADNTDKKDSPILLPDGTGDPHTPLPHFTASLLPNGTGAGNYWAQYVDPAYQCSPGVYSHAAAFTGNATSLLSFPTLCNWGGANTAADPAKFKEWTYAPRYAKHDNRILMRKVNIAAYPGGLNNLGDPKAVALCDSDGVSSHDQVLAFHQAMNERVYGVRHWKKPGEDTNYVSETFSYAAELVNGDLNITSGSALSLIIFLGTPLGPNKYGGNSIVKVQYPGTAAPVFETLPVTCLVHTAF